MAKKVITDNTNNFQHFGSPELSTAYRGQGKGSKKKIETDAIFENVWWVNAQADAEPETLRISMDTKASVDVGEYSRYGRSRGLEPVKALDHDMRPKEKLVPGGILEPVSGRSFLYFTIRYKTRVFMVDWLLLWWNERKQELSDLKHIVINLDNGPECSGRRSQFLKRLVEFSDMTGLIVRMIYYPPYHSKYNGIERYWAGLEKSWNGYLLSTVSVVLYRAANFAWKRVRAIVRLLESTYEKGVKISGKKRQTIEERLERSEKLPLYDITIIPKMVY